MNYTDWKNLPDRTTPLTAENLLNDINNLREEISKIGEYGSNENGEYIKFPNGIMICTKTEKLQIDISSQSGSLYYYTYRPNNTKLPMEFIENPFYTDVSVAYVNHNWLIFVNCINDTISTRWSDLLIFSSQSERKNGEITLKYIAIGKWK